MNRASVRADGCRPPGISVIIPTYNGEPWLDQVLSMLSAQSLVPDEILVVDSGSTDATLDLIANHDVQLLQIPKAQFDHGGTRSMAARRVSGNLVVFLTQDAIPADTEALARLVAPFAADANIAATYGRQLPAAGANPFSAHLRLFNYPEEGALRCLKDRARLGFKTIFISNSFAAYRRQALEQVGFFPERLLFGEDTFTVAKLLGLGYCVQYVSAARVYHSHNYSLWQDFQRYFDIGVFHACEWDTLGNFGTPTGAGKRFALSELAYLLNEKNSTLIPQSVLRSGLKLAAYGVGRRYMRLPRRLARSISMHPNWWD